MNQQVSSSLLMIRPAAFGFNPETAESNTFQHSLNLPGDQISLLARKEFDAMVDMLVRKKIEVDVIEDHPQFPKPDAIFPNNWISLHGDGTVITYPMFSQARRAERRQDLIDLLKLKWDVRRQIHLEHWESDGIFLEGTGSLVLDRVNRIAYAALSPRTSEVGLHRWCGYMGYTSFSFKSGFQKEAVYHTNVIMSIGEGLAIVCDEVVDSAHRIMLKDSLLQTGHEVFQITANQMESFAGNMLMVKDGSGNNMVILSRTAYKSLSENQVGILEQYADLCIADIPVIEQVGGGSVRCMIAENFLPRI